MEYRRMAHNPMMLENTMYRRKNKNPTAIAVMREFYRDYSRRNKHKSQSDSEFITTIKKNSSTEKFTKYLESTAKQIEISTERSPQINKTNSCRFLKGQGLTIKNNKKRLESEKDQNQNRRYFQDNYTKFHPFFNAHSGMKRYNEISSPTNTNILAKQDSNNICNQKKTLTNLCKEMQVSKNMFDLGKEERKSRLKEIRYNWIIENLHRKFQEKEKRQKGRARMEESLEKTKQNIFPRALSRS